MGSRYDAIVIGGGHNGLAAAAYLGKLGKRVIVLEKRDCLGGVAAEEEFHPGYRVPGVLHDTTGVRKSVLDAIGALGGSEAVKLRSEAPPRYIADAGEGGLLLHRDAAKASAEIEKHSKKDAAAYREFRAFLDKVCKPLEKVLRQPAPDASSFEQFASQWEILGAALKIRMLGRRDMMELLRALPMSVRDFLDDFFEFDGLKAGLATPALYGVWGGPWSAGTTTNLLFWDAVAGGGVEGGPAKLVAALEAACKRNRVELRTGAAVSQIVLEAGKVAGVTLSNGDQVDAPIVAAACDPKRTFLDLIEPRLLSLRLERHAKGLRSRGIVAKVHLALDKPLAFSARPKERFVVAQVGATLTTLEKAFDAAKHFGFAENPFLDIYVPTVEDSSLAPEGGEVVSMLVHCAAYDIKGGWSDEKRKALGDAAVAALAAHTTSLNESVVGREVLTPVDLEERYGLTGGHLYHAEHALDQQLSFRPGPLTARYSTPVEGLFLCGSGSHPGGGITCVPGWLGAEAIRKAG